MCEESDEKSSLSSFLFFSFLLCVLKNVDFSMLWKNKKKIQKVQTPKQKRERERDRLTNVSKTPSSSIK